jgi:hypothetical protein
VKRRPGPATEYRCSPRSRKARELGHPALKAPQRTREGWGTHFLSKGESLGQPPSIVALRETWSTRFALTVSWINYLQARVLSELAFNGTDAAIFASRSSIVLAGPVLVTTNTCWPSGFSSATWRRSGDELWD